MFKVRWKDSLTAAAQHLASLDGDVLLASASIIYLGPFSSPYRDRLLQHWQQLLHEQQFTHSFDFDICQIMSNPIELNEWHMQESSLHNKEIQRRIYCCCGCCYCGCCEAAAVGV